MIFLNTLLLVYVTEFLQICLKHMDVQRRRADPHLSLAAQWSQNGRHTQVNSSFFSNIVIDFSSESNDFLPNVTSSHFGQIYLYMVILVAKHSKSKVINCAMILSCCTIT